ncbi:MAG: hypothetical protein WDN08_05705 [Rhizomicrobium sp.]
MSAAATAHDHGEIPQPHRASAQIAHELVVEDVAQPGIEPAGTDHQRRQIECGDGDQHPAAAEGQEAVHLFEPIETDAEDQEAGKVARMPKHKNSRQER